MAPCADRLADLRETTLGVELPVRLRAWDPSEAGPADGPVLVVRSRRALRRLLWRPGELGLARAHVSGDIDVDGDLTDGLRRAWRLSRSDPVAGISLRGRRVAAPGYRNHAVCAAAGFHGHPWAWIRSLAATPGR